MKKLLITEKVLRNLIRATLKEVLDEKFTFQKPKPGEPTIAQRMSYERGHRQIAQQLNRCLKAIPDERAAIMAYKAEPDMWNKAVNTPQTFIMKMKNDENAKNYFNGMLLSREELVPAQESWLFQTLKALGKKCPGQ